MLGGSIITSYMIPPVTRKYDNNTMQNIVFADGIGTDIFFIFKFGGSSTWKGMLYKNSNIFKTLLF
jgi:hypothetical protein